MSTGHFPNEKSKKFGLVAKVVDPLSFFGSVGREFPVCSDDGGDFFVDSHNVKQYFNEEVCKQVVVLEPING